MYIVINSFSNMNTGNEDMASQFDQLSMLGNDQSTNDATSNWSESRSKTRVGTSKCVHSFQSIPIISKDAQFLNISLKDKP